jgi:predicted aspartyl protease
MRLDVAMIIMTLCVACVTRGEATCQMQEIGELPVTVGAEVTIDAKVNGQPVPMLVDTGSADTLLTHPAAARLGLVLRPIRGLRTYGIGGGENGVSARIKVFKVANLVNRDFDMLVQGPHPIGQAQGVLGALFLMQTDVEFDFPHAKIRFFEPKNCKGDQVVYWGSAYSVVPMVGSSKDRIEVTVLLNGRPVRAQMGTGAGVTMVTPAEAANVGVKLTSDGVSTAQLMGGLGRAQFQSYVAVFPSFSFGDETIHNAKITIADMFREDKEVALGSHIATMAVDFPEMLLGDDFFRSHRVYVALGQRKVYASYVGGPVFSTPRAGH